MKRINGEIGLHVIDLECLIFALEACSWSVQHEVEGGVAFWQTENACWSRDHVVPLGFLATKNGKVGEKWSNRKEEMVPFSPLLYIYIPTKVQKSPFCGSQLGQIG